MSIISARLFLQNKVFTYQTSKNLFYENQCVNHVTYSKSYVTLSMSVVLTFGLKY
jgi:hypothetical protein